MADTAITDTKDMEHGFDGFDEPSDTDGRATDEAEAETGAADQDERADGSAPRKQSASASATKATARRAIMKYEDVREADEQVVSVLVAASEGMPANGNRIDIAIRLVSAGRLQLRALDRIDQIAAESDPFDQMAYALSASDADQRRIWDVLAAFGVVEGRLPAKAADIGKGIARGVATLPKDATAVMNAVRDLARK
jgi:hypothetical protein